MIVDTGLVFRVKSEVLQPLWLAIVPFGRFAQGAETGNRKRNLSPANIQPSRYAIGFVSQNGRKG
jgi:hypothetical protein